METKSRPQPNQRTMPWRDRTWRALILAGLLIPAMGMLRLDGPKGMNPKQFWAMKCRWAGCADLVVTGDSRVVQGVAPEIMQGILPGRRILNFGFYGVPYDRNYLQAVEAVLDPCHIGKAVLLGITPRTVNTYALQSDGFKALYANRHRRDFLLDHLGGLIYFLEPMSFKDAWHGLFPRLKPTRVSAEFHADGWVAYRRTPETSKYEMRRYRKIFEQGQTDAGLIGVLLDHTRRWTGRGIRVYGFQPPLGADILNLEKEKSGFDQDGFVREFKAAGGIWLEVDPQGYHCYDNSHLREDAARQLSLDLAKQIHDLERP